MAGMRNPLTDPLFLPTLRIVGLLFVLGLILVLFFARKDLRAGLTGELGKRYIGWMILTPSFLIAVFVGGLLGAAILLFFFYRIVLEYIRVVGVDAPHAGDRAIVSLRLSPENKQPTGRCEPKFRVKRADWAGAVRVDDEDFPP